MTKWGDRPHWEMDAVYLGRDAAGDWIGFPVGTHMSRPGVSITTTNDQVGLVPAAGTAVGQAWLATFHGPGGTVWTYVDMTTVPEVGTAARCARSTSTSTWSRRLDRTVFVDDEDEFDEHRVELRLPARGRRPGHGDARPGAHRRTRTSARRSTGGRPRGSTVLAAP